MILSHIENRQVKIYIRAKLTFAISLLFFLCGFVGSRNACAAVQARTILEATGIQGGFVVHVGCRGGILTAALRANERYVVQGLDQDAGNVESSRRYIRSQGEYGPVSVGHWSGDHLPYADNLVNLVVISNGSDVSQKEIMRVLAPRGAAYIEQPDGQWRKVKKPCPDTIDDWTHFLHDSGGNPVAHDQQVGPIQHLRWQADPMWGRSHEHLPSICAMVSARGRIFSIVDDGPRGSVPLPPRWWVVARDAHNGMLLWKRAISEWASHLNFFRTFPFLTVRRLVADGDRLFVTLGIDAPVSVLDAATGSVLDTYKETEGTEEIIYNDGKLIALVNPTGKAEAFLPHVADGRFKLGKRGATIHRPLGPDPNKGEHRCVVAVNVDTGRVAWRKEAGSVYPRTLAAAGGRVFYQDETEIVCLDLRTGKERWRTADLGCPIPKRPPMVSASLVAWREAVYYVDTYAGDKLVLTALSAVNGSVLWTAENDLTGFGGKHNFPNPHHMMVDLMMANGLVWTALPRYRSFKTGYRIGRDPATGEVKQRLEVRYDPNKVNMIHHRCYRNKATDQYVLTALDGIEFLDLQTGEMQYNNYVRGACNLGVMPANGLVYAPPHSCACNMHIRLKGFVALASSPPEKEKQQAAPERLQRGPAYNAPEKSAGSSKERLGDWPTYRHDPSRSGCSSSVGPHKLVLDWQIKLGGKLTAPVIADGFVYVARTDTYTVHALDSATGKPAWSFTAGARINSPPTFHDGRVLFGSADGYVYCLRAGDGVLVWRFRAAPRDRRIGVCGRIESAWPVHGSVLVLPDKAAPSGASVYFAAGRSAFLDGGISLFRLDVATGKILARCKVSEPDNWETGRSLLKTCGANDVLSFSDGKVYMQHLAFYPEQLERAKPERHLMSSIGFLDDSWWHRSYWMVAADYGEGWGGWPSTGNKEPSGRILALDGKGGVYGFGRNRYPTGSTPQWASGEENILFARGKWFRSPRLTARALALAENGLYVAGSPVIDNLHPGPDADNVFEGKRGGSLHRVERTSGNVLATLELDTGPVFDALAVAHGKAYVCTVGGALVCIGAK